MNIWWLNVVGMERLVILFTRYVLLVIVFGVVVVSIRLGWLLQVINELEVSGYGIVFFTFLVLIVRVDFFWYEGLVGPNVRKYDIHELLFSPVRTKGYLQLGLWLLPFNLLLWILTFSFKICLLFSQFVFGLLLFYFPLQSVHILRLLLYLSFVRRYRLILLTDPTLTFDNFLLQPWYRWLLLINDRLQFANLINICLRGALALL